MSVEMSSLITGGGGAGLPIVGGNQADEAQIAPDVSEEPSPLFLPPVWLLVPLARGTKSAGWSFFTASNDSPPAAGGSLDR